ncbi:GntP family permease [Flavobacteriaceae bacterium]|jgi:GntP family gluconate:H+ symporter|nr:GntP family permease [Flavobacteriaceae bacterium]MDA9016348.1 GntP family permease [Flavobacteriaceae bacterium]MDB3862042.1 GntP family permease [Flavobacteriaceae bacterium]
MLSFLLLFIAIVFIILLTSRFQWHPFIALLIVSLGYGFAVGLSTEELIQSLQDGFGTTLGSIGMIIVAGLIIGTFVEESGGAHVIANFFVKIFGAKRIHWAIGCMGYLISIPVFADSGFVILTPLNKALTKKLGVSLAGTAIALGIGLTAAHTMVPPTPGPLAAAAIIGADLGWVIFIGLITSGVGLLVGIPFAKRMGNKIYIEPDSLSESDVIQSQEELPSLTRTLLPILIPLALIVSKAIIQFPGFPMSKGPIIAVIDFVGHPIIALLIGVFFAIRIPKKRDSNRLSEKGWVGKAIKGSATILLITAAGGAFGKVIQASGVHLSLEPLLKTLPLGIALPFLIAALIKTAQGSSTVAIVTTASIVFPMLTALELTSTIDKALVVVAIGAGATVISHANDSFFWVVTQFSNMTVPQGYRLHSMATLLLGLTALATLFIIKAGISLLA